MKHGDISNRSSPIIAFNFDSLFFTERVKKKEGIVKKVANLFTLDVFKEKSDYFNRELNKENLAYIYKLWKNTDYQIYLVTLKPFVKDIDTFLYEEANFQSYNRIESFATLEELKQEVQQDKYFLYVDSNEYNIAYLGGSAVHIIDLPRFMMGVL